MKKKPTIVLTYGTFDVIHRGHIQLLKRAKALGDKLIVGLSADSFNKIKGKISVFSYKDRKLILENLRFVDAIIPETKWQQKQNDIIKNKVDIFVMGSDWCGKFDELKKFCKVVYLPRTRGISTTLLKKRMSKIKRV